MATRYSIASGNWADTAIWAATSGGAGGQSAPVSGDTANIENSNRVTVAQGTTAACGTVNVANNNNVTVAAGVIINGTFNQDASTNFNIGGGANRDGYIEFGPGGSFVLGNASANLRFSNCQARSTATQDNPFTISGAGSVTNTGTDPKQDIVLSHVKFNQANIFNFALGNTTGSFTSQLRLTNCPITATARISWGTALTTPNTCVFDIVNCDFRNIAGALVLDIRRIAGGVATYRFYHCSFLQDSSSLSIIPTTSTGLLFEECVFQRVIIAPSTTGGGVTFKNSLMTTTAANATTFTYNDGGAAVTILRAYFFGLANNYHPLQGTGSGGSGTHSMTYIVLDGQMDGGTFTDKPDVLLPGANSLAIDYGYNLVINTGEHVAGFNTPTYAGDGLTVHHSTLANGTSNQSGHLHTPEGNANGGTINIHSNNQSGNGADTAISGADATPGTPQVVADSRNNNFYNVANPYEALRLDITAGNTTKTVPDAASGETADNPRYYDPTRNLKRWNLIFGSGTQTDAAAIAYFLGINGYRGTPNFDQQGTVSPMSVSTLIDWVREGYAPTNLALRGTGVGGTDKGAVPVRSPAGICF